MRIDSLRLLKLLSKIVFISYLLLLIWIVVFKCNLIFSLTQGYEYMKTLTISERIVMYLIPFEDYINSPIYSPLSTKLSDGFLNILIFIPLGLYLAFFIENKKFAKIIFISFGLSIIFEIFQLFSLIGSFQTEDLILNVLGSIIGFLFYKLLFKNQALRLKILNICSLVVIGVCIPIIVYAVVNTIKNFDIYIAIFNRSL